MYFRLLAQFVFIFSFVGCSMQTDEEAYKKSPIRIEQNMSCIDGVGEKFESYFDAELSDEEISEFFTCARRALKEFKDNSQGINKGEYSPQELRKFLETYFIKKNSMTDELISEAMEIKKVMVGGSEKVLSSEDINKGIELLGVVSEVALMLNPHLKVILNGFDDSLDYEDGNDPIDQSIAALNVVSDRFGSELVKNKGKYEFSRLKRFVREFRIFLNWNEEESGRIKLEEVNNWLHFAKVFKGMLFDGNERVVESHEWPKYLKETFGWYGIYLRYKYHIKHKSILFGKGLKRLNKLVSDVILSAKNIIFNRSNKKVPLKYIYRISYAMEDLHIVPFNIRAKTIEENIRIYLNRTFGDLKHPFQKRNLDHVNLSHIRNMEYEYGLWSSVQGFLDENRTPDGRVDIPNEVASVNFMKCYSNSQPSRFVDPRCEIIRLIYQRPMFEHEVNSIYLDYGSQRSWKDVLFINLSRMNVIRATVRLLILAYGEWSDPKDHKRVLNQVGITMNEFEKFYSEAKPLGVDLKIMHPDGVHVGRRSFKEGRMFTYSGKGCSVDEKKELVTYGELNELISIVYSGGNLARSSYNSLLEICKDKIKKGDPKGVHGNPMIDFYCYRDNMREVLLNNIDTMPGMKKYLLGLTDQQFKEFHSYMYSSFFNPREYDYRLLELSDLMSFFTILHYMEIAVTRYDINQDGVLDFYEVNEMYETFKGFFLVVEKNPSLAKMAFFYTIYAGKVPEKGISLHPMAKQVMWDIPNLVMGQSEAESLEKNDYENVSEKIRNMKVDRTGLARAFAIVGKFIRQSNEVEQSSEKEDVCQ